MITLPPALLAHPDALHTLAAELLALRFDRQRLTEALLAIAAQARDAGAEEPDFPKLCEELADALHNAIRVIHHEGGTKHISTARPVLARARSALISRIAKDDSPACVAAAAVRSAADKFSPANRGFGPPLISPDYVYNTLLSMAAALEQ